MKKVSHGRMRKIRENRREKHKMKTIWCGMEKAN